MPFQTVDYTICETKVSLRIERQPQAIPQNTIHKRIIKIGHPIEVFICSGVYSKYRER